MLAPLPDAVASGAACARPQSLACPAPDAAAASASAYRAVCLAQPSEALYPTATAATSPDAPGCATQDACLPALCRAAAQMVLVALQVRRPPRPIQPAVKDTIARL